MEFSTTERYPATLKTIKYVYLDLRTLRCQDYLKFDTTEVPESNYKLTQKEVLQWNFYYPDTSTLYFNHPIKLRDTIIEKKCYERVSYTKTFGEEKLIKTMYLTKEYDDNLFHLFYPVDYQFYPLKAVRCDDYLNNKLAATVYYEQKSTVLTNFERTVFKKWEYNALHSKLPLLTTKQVFEKMK